MMKNLEVLEEIRKQGKNLIETKRDEFVKQNLLSDEFIQMMQKNKKPFELLMSYYQCAIMEIETKFRVLNQEYSLSDTSADLWHLLISICTDCIINKIYGIRIHSFLLILSTTLSFFPDGQVPHLLFPFPLQNEAESDDSLLL